LFLVACGGGGDESVEARCERVRDRLVDLELADAAAVDRAAHAKAMRNALGRDFVARCASSLTDSQRDCVLAARDAASASACSKR
jgi:hypothetical protein